MDSFTQVEAGSVAVVKQFGQVVGVFQPGLNWKVPFVQQTVLYRTQEILYETSEDPTTSQADYRDVEVDTATADGQQILARYTIRFRIDPTKAPRSSTTWARRPRWSRRWSRRPAGCTCATS